MRGTNEACNCTDFVGKVPGGGERRTKPFSLESMKDSGVVASGPRCSRQSVRSMFSCILPWALTAEVEEQLECGQYSARSSMISISSFGMLCQRKRLKEKMSNIVG